MLAVARDELLDHRYRVVRWIGQGASAAVYEAIDTELDDRSVAIKILNTELVSSTVLQARFVKEAEAALHIDSPFVVAVHAVGELEDGHPYIVMELLEGENLGRLLERVVSLEEEHAVELMIHALSGLAHAHSRGVLHRDIKPDNLVIARSDSGEEVLKIVDLGISKVVDEEASLTLTRTNAVLGSPVYMSPEQARGMKNMDHRSDIYSVGVVLYECLTGKLPHDGENFNQLMFSIALQDAPDPRKVKPSLDADLVEIVMKGLAREPEARFQSASKFREALLEWGAERGARVPPAPSSTRTRMTPLTPSSRAGVSDSLREPKTTPTLTLRRGTPSRAGVSDSLREPETAPTLTLRRGTPSRAGVSDSLREPETAPTLTLRRGTPSRAGVSDSLREPETAPTLTLRRGTPSRAGVSDSLREPETAPTLTLRRGTPRRLRLLEVTLDEEDGVSDGERDRDRENDESGGDVIVDNRESDAPVPTVETAPITTRRLVESLETDADRARGRKLVFAIASAVALLVMVLLIVVVGSKASSKPAAAAMPKPPPALFSAAPPVATTPAAVETVAPAPSVIASVAASASATTAAAKPKPKRRAPARKAAAPKASASAAAAEAPAAAEEPDTEPETTDDP